MQQVTLVGLGAIGAAYASRLVDAGVDLRVLADADRAARYRLLPTVVNGRSYDFDVEVAPQLRPAELVIVAVKHSGLAAAIQLLRPVVTADTVIVSLLNGIGSEAELAREFPQATVLLAVSVGIDAVRDDREVHFTSLGRILFGEAVNPGPASDKVEAVGELLGRAGIEHCVPAHMVRELWWKFLINVGVNQVSAVLRAPYRVFQASDQPAREVMLAAQREVIAVANAKGVGLTETDLDAWQSVLAKLGPDNYTSMAQDALAGRPTEVDIFAGTMIELGRETGVPVPVNTTLYGLLKAAESR